MLVAFGLSVCATALNLDIHMLVPQIEAGDSYRNSIALMGDVLHCTSIMPGGRVTRIALRSAHLVINCEQTTNSSIAYHCCCGSDMCRSGDES
jgi:hypothetical protein